jgi:hypothetical protein
MLSAPRWPYLALLWNPHRTPDGVRSFLLSRPINMTPCRGEPFTLLIRLATLQFLSRGFDRILQTKPPLIKRLANNDTVNQWIRFLTQIINIVETTNPTGSRN